jgi:hypothetical protein
MEKLIVYPADNKQAIALKNVLQEMHIDYLSVSESKIEAIEDEALVNAMKQTEGEEPLSDEEQAEFMKWVKAQA